MKKMCAEMMKKNMKIRKSVCVAKAGYITISLMFCLGGILLMFNPDMPTNLLGIVVGILLVVCGAVKLIGYFSKDLYRLAFQFDLAMGVFAVIAGVILLVKEKTIMNYFQPLAGALILALLLIVPSVIGMVKTRINYDMLTYLPKGIDTVTGQDILMDEFGKGAFSFVIIEDMAPKDVAELRSKIEQVEHVDTVLWYDSFADVSIPMEMLPDKYYDAFNAGNATMLAIFFDTSTSADETMNAIEEIRSIAGKQCFVSGMSAMVTDLKALCEKEEPIYVGLAVVLACVAMMLFMDNWIIPFVFLAGIGMAILLNMGTNYFLGEISYLTKALSAVLQLAVTMDYSIFLWHSYEEQKEQYADNKEAMAVAISKTVTTLPAMILALDKLLAKTGHKSLIPGTGKLSDFIIKYFPVFLILFVVILIPAYYGYDKTNNEMASYRVHSSRCMRLPTTG